MGGGAHARAEQLRAMCASTVSSRFFLRVVLRMPPGPQVLVGPRAREFSEREVSLLHPWLSGMRVRRALTGSQRPCLPFELELSWNSGKGSGGLRNRTKQGILSYPCHNIVGQQTMYTENNEGKGK